MRVARARGGRRGREVNFKAVRGDMSVGTGRAQLDRAAHRSGELAGDEDGVAGAQRGDPSRVDVDQARREGERDVAGGRELGAQAQLAGAAAGLNVHSRTRRPRRPP